MKRVLLCILDGWGVAQKHASDATAFAYTPNIDKLLSECPNTTLRADGEFVGLPKGQMGNSEVGHLNIGAGRVVYQDLTRINKEVEEGAFYENKAFLGAIEHAKKNTSALHLMGLVSDGGVHSCLEHLYALIKLAHLKGLKKVYVHAFLDGRDTPPSSGAQFVQCVEDVLKKYSLPPVASVMGRYWAMDRDNRWDRVEKAYECLTLGKSVKDKNAVEIINESYKNEKTDEFVEPVAIGGDESRIQDNDSIIFFNYRPDRAREITRAFTFEDFDGFKRNKVLKNLFYVGMSQYDESFNIETAYGPQKLNNILGEVLEREKVTQFRTAETEKYAHVTFFFNGGLEEAFKHEERVLVSSPKVATYDLQPEMSAREVTEKVLGAINDPKYNFILVNFANPDMVGHTGNLTAAVRACEVIDECVGKIIEGVKAHDVVALFSADHGNAEFMYNETTHAAQTAHTTNPVPFILLNYEKHVTLKEGGSLQDIAPTVLDIMNIEKPQEMSGNSLIERE